MSCWCNHMTTGLMQTLAMHWCNWEWEISRLCDTEEIGTKMFNTFPYWQFKMDVK